MLTQDVQSYLAVRRAMGFALHSEVVLPSPHIASLYFPKHIVIRYYLEESIQGELPAADYQALAEFRYQIRRFLRFSEQASRLAGLEPAQHQLLLAVKAHTGEPTVGELAERLQLRHHSVVGLIDRLVNGGLVRRSRAKGDRRQVCVRLTPKGERVLGRLSLEHRAELESVGKELAGALRKIAKDRVSNT